MNIRTWTTQTVSIRCSRATTWSRRIAAAIWIIKRMTMMTLIGLGRPLSPWFLTRTMNMQECQIALCLSLVLSLRDYKMKQDLTEKRMKWWTRTCKLIFRIWICKDTEAKPQEAVCFRQRPTIITKRFITKFLTSWMPKELKLAIIKAKLNLNRWSLMLIRLKCPTISNNNKRFNKFKCFK